MLLIGLPSLFRRYALFGLCICMGVASMSASARAFMPSELYDGWVRFQVESGRYLDALVLMDERFEANNPILKAAALEGFNLDGPLAAMLDQLPVTAKDLTPYEWFAMGKVFYHADQCVPALKSFKRLKNKLSLEEKQEWAFYRANCFIRLGSDARAAQVLSDILSGRWISHAYYNLAMSYAETSSSKTKALVALRVAASVNGTKTSVERELNDRVNFAAGAILLNENKADMATEFFKKVHLDSMIAPQALYLNGVAQLENSDFRSATQSWVAVKKHSLIKDGVPESLLAIPYAYERGGYVSQAIEAYVEASDYFEKELDTIDKIEDLIVKHGFNQVMIEEKGLEGLEWFLTKDVARNTIRAAYYTHFLEDAEMYQYVELLEELKLLQSSLDYWSGQLRVFAESLRKKRKTFARSSAKLDVKAIEKRIAAISARFDKLDAVLESRMDIAESLDWPQVEYSVSVLDKRLAATEKAAKQGSGQLQQRGKTLQALQKRLNAHKKQLAKLVGDVDKRLADLAATRLELLRLDVIGHFERSEQGLIHILQTIAESKQAQQDRLDGRYQ